MKWERCDDPATGGEPQWCGEFGDYVIVISREPWSNAEKPYYAWVNSTFVGWCATLKETKRRALEFALEKELDQ